MSAVCVCASTHRREGVCELLAVQCGLSGCVWGLAGLMLPCIRVPISLEPSSFGFYLLIKNILSPLAGSDPEGQCQGSGEGLGSSRGDV